jgi:YidC/Oxa1 family membrane protein insertase
MERRFFLAILLSFAVLYGYQALFVPPAPKTQQTVTPPPTTSSAARPSAANAPSATSTESAQPAAEPTPAESAPSEGETDEREIIVDTATVQVVLTNRGGRVLHWRLKAFKDQAGNQVDLVPTEVPSDQPRPFSLIVNDGTLTQRINSALYRVSGDTNGHVDATSQPAQLVFEFEGAGGLSVRKEFGFTPRNYLVTLSASASEGARSLQPGIAWGPGLGDAGALAAGGSFFTGNYTQPPEAIFHRDGSWERVLASKLGDQGSMSGQYRYAGVDDHYFIAAAIEPGQGRLDYRPVILAGPGGTKRSLLAHTVYPSSGAERIRYFVGPKQFDALQAVDPEFTRAINFGMFRVISVPLLSALKWVHSYIGNWGWSIIVLTILINLAIAPLRHKSVVSMRKMQALQPQLKVIQDHYAGLKVTDPAKQKMNTEIMNLYREKGVNPASGCVPMLLTMPILFAFYGLLSQAIELRGAEFGLWIKDLSEHDPYYVTPVLMAITMFWQQRITPSTADPAQQKIMMMMPLMFGVMFLWVPSGLVLYWFVGNLWAIGQQYFTNWMIGPPALATTRPPAERRMKSAGGGRTAAADRKT